MTIEESKKRKMLSYRWLIFAALALAYFFVYFHRTTGGAISTSLQEYFGVGTASVALLASAYLYAYTLMQIPSGILTDRMGPRTAASAFIALIAVGSVLSAVSASMNNFNLMIAGKFLIGIGAAVVYIPIMKVLAVWFRKNEFATMSGILLLVGNVGGIAAATPMVIMMDALGIQNTYIVLAVITAVIAGLCWLLVRNHPSEKDLPSIEEIVSEETGKPITESTSEKMGTTEALKRTFTSGMNFWPLAIWFFVMYGTIMLWQASQAGAFYKNIYSFSTGDAGLLITMGNLADRIGRVVCPLGVGEHFERWGFAPERVVEMYWHESAEVDCRGVRLVFRCLPSRHFSGRTFKRNQSLWASFLVESPSRKVYFAGDGGYDERFRRIGARFPDIDLAVLENGQYNVRWPMVHTLPDELGMAMHDLGARRYATVHHGKFCISTHPWDEPFENERKAAAAAGVALLAPKIGEVSFLRPHFAKQNAANRYYSFGGIEAKAVPDDRR